MGKGEGGGGLLKYVLLAKSEHRNSLRQPFIYIYIKAAAKVTAYLLFY